MSASISLLGQIPPAVYAVAGAVIGSAITAISGRKGSERVAEINADAKLAELEQKAAEEFRRELRQELERLQERLKHVEEELDEWKTSYYKLYEEKAELAVENATLKGTIDLLEAKIRVCHETHGD